MQLLIVYNAVGDYSDDDDPDLLSEIAVQDEVRAVHEAACKLGFRTTLLPVADIADTLHTILDLKPDIIFNLCESYRGIAQYEMHMASLWELTDIPYTGNCPLTLGLAQDKVLTKRLLDSRKIHTPAYQVFQEVPQRIMLDFPLIVKPSREDASIGIGPHSVVKTLHQLQKSVEFLLRKFNQPVLVERFISGREFNISLMGNPPKVLAISEVDFSKLPADQPPLTSYEAKWMPDHILYQKTPVQCPAHVTADLKERLEDVAIQVYTLVSGRDYGRVDTRVDSEGRIHVLEFNPNPDISPDAGFSKAIRFAGMSYSEFVNEMIKNALNRKKNGSVESITR